MTQATSLVDVTKYYGDHLRFTARNALGGVVELQSIGDAHVLVTVQNARGVTSVLLDREVYEALVVEHAKRG
jgi:hypothetical protein